jgi:hypothetical protein
VQRDHFLNCSTITMGNRFNRNNRDAVCDTDSICFPACTVQCAGAVELQGTGSVAIDIAPTPPPRDDENEGVEDEFQPGQRRAPPPLAAAPAVVVVLPPPVNSPSLASLLRVFAALWSKPHSDWLAGHLQWLSGGRSGPSAQFDETLP